MKLDYMSVLINKIFAPGDSIHRPEASLRTINAKDLGNFEAALRFRLTEKTFVCPISYVI